MPSVVQCFLNVMLIYNPCNSQEKILKSELSNAMMSSEVLKGFSPQVNLKISY